MHWAGEMEVLPDQLHALSIHELIRRQDLSQHPLASAESLQNLSKAWATCTRHRTSGTRQSRASPKPTQIPCKAACQPNSQLACETASWSCRSTAEGNATHQPTSTSHISKMMKTEKAPQGCPQCPRNSFKTYSQNTERSLWCQDRGS